MGDLASAFIPRMGAISNDRLIRRLKEWRCEIVKVSGEWTSVLAGGEVVRVNSAHVHTRTGPEAINRILRAMDLTWDQFMSLDIGPATQQQANEMLAIEQDMVKQIQTYIAGGKIPEYAIALLHVEALKDNGVFDKQQERISARDVRKSAEAEARRTRKESRTMSTPATPIPSIAPQKIDLSNVAVMADLERMTAPDEAETSAQKKIRVRVINRVFDLLVAAGEPMSAQRMAGELGATRSAVTSACLALVRYAVAERVKPGVYRAVVDMQQQDTTRLNVQMGNAPIQVATSAPVAPLPIVQVPLAAFVPPTMSQVAQSYEAMHHAERSTVDQNEVIDDVLDLMFPEGMRIKAADITLLEQWKNLTAEVIRRVSG